MGTRRDRARSRGRRGIDWDLRRDMPYDAYGEVEFDVPIAEEGDVYARYRVRMAEMRE